MNKLLTDSDRAFALQQLQDAPDSVIANAFMELQTVRASVLSVRTAAGGTPPVAVATTHEEVTVEKRKNVSPGLPSIGKIGGPTKTQVLGYLDNGTQPPAKFAEHLKLLWSRGEVKFDGKEYYL